MPQDTRARSALGWGLRTQRIEPAGDIGLDLTLRDGPRGRDLALASGQDHLANVLGLDLLTRLGGDPFHPERGFDGLNALADATSPVLQLARVRVAIVRVLARDPRVARIHDVTASFQRSTRTLELSATVDTVAGAQLTLEILGG